MVFPDDSEYIKRYFTKLSCIKPVTRGENPTLHPGPTSPSGYTPFSTVLLIHVFFHIGSILHESAMDSLLKRVKYASWLERVLLKA